MSSAALFVLASVAARAEQRTTLNGHVPSVVGKAKPMGVLAGDKHLRLAIGLPLRNPEGLTNLLHDIYDPASTNYHHYITPEQFTAQFGPTEADYQALIGFVRSNGFVLTNHLHPNRMLLDVDAPVSAIEKAFNLHMGTFKHPTENRNFYAPTNEPSVPAGLQVVDISGLSDYSIPHPKYSIQTNSTNAKPKLGSGPLGSYMGPDFRAAYCPGVTFDGTGQTVGLLQFDGYFASDIAAYENINKLPAVPLQNVLLDGFNGTPTGFGGEIEVSLDLEMVISMAPGVSQIIVYEAGPFGTPNDILNRMANDNLAKSIGCSWGWSGGPQSSTEQIFLQMAAQGQTFCNASGDNCAFAPGQVDDPTYTGSPSSSPNILQVGATTLYTSGPVGSLTNEQVWNWGGGVGSSGGISSFYLIPSWQASINMTTNMGSTTHRNIPDVAMVGDNVYVIADQGIPYLLGGTSCAAPLWAGFTALVNQKGTGAGLPTVGFMNAALYGIGTGINYTNCFNDTVIGNNTNFVSPNLFYACPGYDLCTGWGTPSGSNLINALAPGTPQPFFTIITNSIVGGNGNGVVDPNECNSLFVSMQNSGPAAATTIQVQIATTTPGVVVAQSLASYPKMTNGVIATNVNPFEISTTPYFVCGTPIYLTLTITCDQNISTKVLVLQSGNVGSPMRFDNSTPVVVATGSTNGTASTVIVSNIDTTVQHVSVSAYIFDSFDFDLNLSLVAPDGTTVSLAQSLGGTGQNFGIDCTDPDRTTFDDNSTVSLLNATAPFIGTFKPESALSVLNGKGGTNVNGSWQLLAVDPFTGDYAAIECWSLFLSPGICTDGGGQCPGVDLALGMTGLPNPIQVGSNITYTMMVTNLGPDTASSVALIQSLPNSVNFVSASSSQGICTHTGSIVSCSLGTLQPAQSASITVVVTPTQAGTIYSSATVGCQEQELNPANNSATVANQVNQPAADLAVSIQANPSPVLLDGLLTYTATVVNQGPATATNVLLTNVLPQNVQLISLSTSQGTVSSSANLVIASLGTLKPGSNAVVVARVEPLVQGQIVDTVSVSSPVFDPTTANNTATIKVNVTAAADLVLTMTGPSSVVVGSNYNYQLNVVNLGPSVATDVSIRDALPGGVTFVNANSALGTIVLSNNAVICNLASLAVGSNLSMTISVGTSNLFGSAPVSVVNTATVTSDQADPIPTNNSASLSTLVSYPTLTVVASSYQLISESSLPTNGMIDPGETVSVSFLLQNIGNIDSAPNLTATLLNSGGVTPVGTQTQNYGTLSASGPAVGKTFTFTASPTNGGTIIASLQLQNNGTNLSVTFPFTLTLSNNFANTNNIIIPDHGPGVPFPSTNIVSGIAGTIGKVTVTFTNFNHTYPDDVELLLVGPNGQNVLLMSHAGYNGVLTNSTISFDSGVTNGDGTPKLLPPSSQIVSGVYQPSQYGSVEFTNTFNGTVTIPTNNPPPAGPYGTNLNIFNGTSANGKWVLYVFDGSVGDQGIIIGGWSLGITAGAVVNPVADIGVTGKGNPSSLQEGANLTYTFTVTNSGPNPANVVQFTDPLPVGMALVSATNNAHTACTTNGAGAVVCSLTNMAASNSIIFTIVATPNAAGTITNTATVAGSAADPGQANNSANVVTTVTAPLADLAVTMSGGTNSITGNPVPYTITVINNGPGTALNVVVTDATQGVLGFVSGTASGSSGQPFSTNQSVVCNVGTLASGAVATINLSLVSTQALTFNNTVTATTSSSDTNSANNSASVVTVFQNPSPSIVASSAKLISGGVNGSLVSGHSVTVALALANVGTSSTSSLIATLQSGNGVTSPSGAANYGVLVNGGSPRTNNFTFTPTGGNGGIITATLQLNDGANNLGTVSFTFNLPATNTFASKTTYILIPDHGAATPYPATIAVSNLVGVVTKATVTVSNFSHQFPNDVEMLVAAPSGQNIVLMAHNGGGTPVNNLVFTFDDAAQASLPNSSGANPPALVSGTFLPTDDGLALAFPSPAPASTTGTALAAFNGLAPNGNWSLYVFDNSPGDSGGISGGWSINLSTINPVNLAADLAVGMISPGGTLYAGNQATVTITVTNKGPATASNVTVTNSFSAGLSFVSSSVAHSLGAAGTVLCNIGSLAVGTSTNFTVTVTPASGGNSAVTANVGADQADVNPADNSASAILVVQGAAKLGAKSVKTNGVFALSLSLTGGEPGTYNILASTNLTTWTNIATVTNSGGPIQFIDTNAANFKHRYYRAVLAP